MKRALAYLLIFSLVTMVTFPRKTSAEVLNNVDCGELVWEQGSEASVDPSLSTYYERSGLERINVNDADFTALATNELYLDMAELLDYEGYGNSEIHIDVSYYSKEYMDELKFNSQENIYFGYTLSELDALFEGTRYVFACDDTGVTTFKQFESYDDTYEQALRNVAIGTGIIIICITVTLATGGFGAPIVAGSTTSAVNFIFSTAATESAVSALFGGVVSSIVAGATIGTQTKDWEEIKKTVALSGSEGFMWGAVIGTGTGMVSGVIQYGYALKAVKALPQTSLDDILRHTPVDGSSGKWVDGIRGNGKFVPEDPAMKQMLANSGLDGIIYKNGVPDFSALAYDKVEITGKYLDVLNNPNSTQVRQAMQLEARELLAVKRGVSVKDIRQWMQDNRITIHEDINMTTLSFVPTDINKNFLHLGGVSEYMTRIAKRL